MAKNGEKKEEFKKWYGCATERLNVRKEADLAAETLFDPPVYIEAGETFEVLDKKNGWLKTEKGWIYRQGLVYEVEKPKEKEKEE